MRCWTMFKLIEQLPPLDDPFMGCEIQTLYGCYHTDWKRLTLYGCGNAVALKYGSRLYLSGKTDPKELEEFCKIMHISRIEALQGDVEGCLFGRQSVHSVMVARANLFTYSSNIVKNDDLYTVFDILRQSDAEFARHMQYFYYLSEARTRINHAMGDVYLFKDCTTGAVWSKSKTYALIGYVATAPKHRGQGHGKALLSHIACDSFSQGKTPCLVSFDANTDRFYEKCGFAVAAKKAIIKL